MAAPLLFRAPSRFPLRTPAKKMAEKAAKASEPPKRGPGHRAVDARDAIAELTERAQEISTEAGTKVSEAMKDVISAAAGIAGFAVESARDLISYMVRRSQMTPEEGDKLLREAEIAHNKRPKSERNKATATEIQAKERAIQRAKAAAMREKEMQKHIAMVTKAHQAASKPAKKSAPKKKAKPAAKKKKGGKRR
jgi:polyhydroxyalkanoate synthesis regulator phasin